MRNWTAFNCRWENWSLISWVQVLHNSSSSCRLFSGLSSTSLCTSDRPEQLFNLCSHSRLMEGFLITPMRYIPRFNMQLIFSTGFRYKHPGTVLATNIWSRLRNICKAIIAILTLRSNMQCLGPLSVYIIRAGGICSMGPYFAINAFATSCMFLKAEKRLMAVIFNEVFGSPWYNESSTRSPIGLIKITVGINDKFEISRRVHFSNKHRTPTR